MAVEDGAARIALKVDIDLRGGGKVAASVSAGVPARVATGIAAARISAGRVALHADWARHLADSAGDGQVARRRLRAGAGLAVMVVAAGGRGIDCALCDAGAAVAGALAPDSIFGQLELIWKCSPVSAA